MSHGVCPLCSVIRGLGFIAMPTYVYQVITDDDTPEGAGGEGEIFEVFQKMSDDPLTEHPETGEPVQRIPAPPLIAGKWSELGKDGGMMSNKNIDRLGFTKYEKARIIGARALQISMGAPFKIKLTDKKLQELKYNPLEIARLEFEEGAIPITVKRPKPHER